MDGLEAYEEPSLVPFEIVEGIQEFDFLAGAAIMSRARAALAAYTSALAGILEGSIQEGENGDCQVETAKKVTKNVKKKANAQKKKKILLLEQQVMGASIDEARANVKHISMDQNTVRLDPPGVLSATVTHQGPL